MQGGLAPLSNSIVLAAARSKRTAAVFPFRASSRPVGVGEGPIASASGGTASRPKVKGSPTAAVPGQGVVGLGAQGRPSSGRGPAAAAVVCPGFVAVGFGDHQINNQSRAGTEMAGFRSGHPHMARRES